MTKLSGSLLVGDKVHCRDNKSFVIVARVDEHTLAGVDAEHRTTRLFDANGHTSSGIYGWNVIGHELGA